MSGIQIKTLRIYVPECVDIESVMSNLKHVLYLNNSKGRWL